MHARKLHLHSMMVHAVLAAVPLAAAALLLERGGVTVAGCGPEVWRFLLWVSLVTTLAVALPSTLSGVLERRHMYVTWHATHKAKLALSLALIALVACELAALASGDAGALTAIAIVVGNTAVAAALSVLGLKMTLGRHGLGGTSYVADLAKNPPVDVLAATAARLAEPADLIDPMGELAQ